MTAEHVSKIKDECTVISKIIMKSGPTEIWKPEKLTISRYSHLG
jgi:hypothetical protein